MDERPPFSLEDFDRLVISYADLDRLDAVKLRTQGMRSAALRKKRYRRRLRNGRIVLSVEAKGFELVATLIQAGFVTEQEALDRRKVEAAAAKVLQAWVEHWRENNN